MKTIETWCPIFSGFYNTIWEFDETNELDNLSEDSGRTVTYDDIEIDYKTYELDICKEFVSAIEKPIMKIFPAIKEISMQKLVSPKEYNFSTDSIDIVVKATNKLTKQIQEFLLTNGEAWSTYLKNHYTSCDGFWSSYPNNTKGWIEKTNNYSDLDNHYLGAILQFACEISDDDDLKELNLYEAVKGNVYEGDYISLKPIEKKA